MKIGCRYGTIRCALYSFAALIIQSIEKSKQVFNIFHYNNPIVIIFQSKYSNCDNIPALQFQRSIVSSTAVAVNASPFAL